MPNITKMNYTTAEGEEQVADPDNVYYLRRADNGALTDALKFPP